jgi:hypothetical protein
MMSEGLPMIEVRPTVLNFSEPMKTLEALVLQKKLVHDGDPVLGWMVSNVVAHLDAKDNIYPRKERAENKIDGIVALIMALSRAIKPGDSVVLGSDYELMLIAFEDLVAPALQVEIVRHGVTFHLSRYLREVAVVCAYRLTARFA